MSKYYFSDSITIISTLLLFGVLIFIPTILLNQKKIKSWKTINTILFLLGLFLCIFVVMRDDYVLAMQGGVGVFSLNSPQILLAYFCALLIGVLFVTIIFTKKESIQKYIFFVLSFIIIFKTVLIEFSRTLL